MVKCSIFFQFFFQNLFGTSSMSVSPNISESSLWSSSLPTTPSFYQDPFLRGEVPLEVNGRDVASPFNNFAATSQEANASGNGFLRSEVPFEVTARNVASHYNNFAAKSLEANASGNGPNPYLPKGIRNKVKFNFCVFCKNNGEDER